MGQMWVWFDWDFLGLRSLDLGSVVAMSSTGVLSAVLLSR